MKKGNQNISIFNNFYLVEPNKSVTHTHTHSLYLYTGLSSKQEEHVACVVNNRLIQGEVCIAFSINAVQASLYLCSISSNCRYSDLILNNFQMFPKWEKDEESSKCTEALCAPHDSSDSPSWWLYDAARLKVSKSRRSQFRRRWGLCTINYCWWWSHGCRRWGLYTFFARMGWPYQCPRWKLVRTK